MQLPGREKRNEVGFDKALIVKQPSWFHTGSREIVL